MNWRSLWVLFTQAVVVFAAAAIVFAVFQRTAQLPDSYSDAVSRALPSVVSIYGRSSDGGSDNDGSVGSGVIVSKDGHILTNYHLIANVGAIEVRLKDGDSHTAVIVGVDPEIDIAVLRITASDLPAIAAANDSQLAPGDIVFAIGNPFGLNRTTTMGIVSAIGRDRLGLHNFERFIQTDAAINPGSSGGALANAKGQLVGINSALFYRQRGITPQGIGFAVPAGLAMRSYERLVAESDDNGDDGDYWGAEIRQMSPRLRDDIVGNKTASRLLVAKVRENSPAAVAGVKAGDIVLMLDGDDADKSIESQWLPTAAKRLVVLRGGSEHMLVLAR